MNRLALLSLGLLALGAAGCRNYTDCGDGFCEGTETATTCPGDCGPPVCGDGICRAETCGSCPGDCGACPACGDGTCNGSESCGSCPADCSAFCATCGDGRCVSGESCGSCPSDCGSCTTCGDRFCDVGESCATCTTDCGTCGGDRNPYETCSAHADCQFAHDMCVPIVNGPITRGMCTVTMCANDTDCDDDMFGAQGDCLTFGGGTWNCYHRCLNDSDCYPGWGCYNPAGSTGAIGFVCMPE
jgi:hypothetical protein